MLQAFTNNKEHSLKWQDWVTCFSCLMMLGGLIFSRLFLSLGMIVLFLNALHPSHIKEHWSQFKKSKFALASVAFFMAYLISGLWSEDKSNWSAVVQIKLPFLFFPFAMLSLPLRSFQWLKIVIGGLLLFLLGGMCYGFYFLITDAQSYSGGNHMPSPMEGDYIRFTIMIVLAMIFLMYFIRNKKEMQLSNLMIGFIVFWLVIAVAYIHIQAAKTGLVAFCIFAIVFILDYGIRKRKFAIMFLYLALLAAGEVAFSKLPAMSKQINNFAIEKKVMETKDPAGINHTSSFVPRINSYKVGGEILKHNPILGVGAGDTKREMDKLYDVWFPGLAPISHILPHNEFLCTMLAIGIPLSLITLVLMVFAPLSERKNNHIYFLTTWLILFFGLMIEPMLEVQFGIFVFLFFIYLWTDIPVGKPEHQSIDV